MKKRQFQNGITLIALILTILLLLILVFVVISNIKNDNLIGTAELAVNTFTNEITDEQQILNEYKNYLGNTFTSSYGNIPNSSYKVTEILDSNGHIPGYEYYLTSVASRSIRALKAYDGKIFMGLGDWNNNTGPVHVIYYDTVDGTIKTSGTINDEAIENFNIINNKLYTTGCDPRDSWGYGSYYTYNTASNTWEQHLKNNGWIHVFNIMEFKNKLYMCGSTVDTTQTSTIQVSYDNGETFENVPVYKNNTLLPYDSALRCYNLIKLNNKLYAYFYYSPYSGFYEYDESNNCFNYISNFDSTVSYNRNKLMLEYDVFNNTFVYASDKPYLYTSTNLKTFNKIQIDSISNIREVLVYGNTLYVLSYIKNTVGNYTTRIYSTKDLSNFSLVCEFTIPTQPYSLEYYNNIFYVGTHLALSSGTKPYSLRSSYSLNGGQLFKITF